MSTKKLVWLTMSCLIVLVLVLSSCSKTTTTQTTTPTEVKGTVAQPTTPATAVKPTTSTTAASSIEKTPAYGGNVIIAMNFDTLTFDDCYTWSATTVSWSVNITNDELNDGDWSAGLAGRGEVTWRMSRGFEGSENYARGFGLAESWEMTKNPNTWIFHLRKGARWAMNPSSAAAKLVNGREVTADDVVASMNRQWATPLSHASTTNARAKPISIVAVDKYTVAFTWETFGQMTQTVSTVGDMYHIWPKEALAAYNNDLRDWRLSVGSGPFILKDYVKGSSATYVKNPDYWKTYNVPGPGFGKQVPFIDDLKILVITDLSTRLAAMRTGKVDQSSVYTYEDTVALLKSNPELKDAMYLESYGALFFRLDKPEQPWANIKVRQALMMAIDFNSIVKDYYKGHAAIYTTTLPLPEFKDMSVAMKDLPANVQELYSYNPEKAKQYLKDAGYANGFTTEVVCDSTQVDLLSVFKDRWSKIGVTLNLDVKESAVYNSIRTARTHKELFFGTQAINNCFIMAVYRIGSTNNSSYINDARIEKAYNDIWDNYLDWNKRCQVFKEITPYILEQAWFIPTPAYEGHTLWQPWIMGYNGEYGCGNSDWNTWAQYVWIDQSMKQKMIGIR
jgi:peptide/nickel transport system substrate-binding protein